MKQTKHHERISILKKRMNGILLLIFIPVLMFLCVSCGVKGLPVASKSEKPPVVNDLTYSITDDLLKLIWDKSSGNQETAFFLIYRAKESTGDTDCPNCPLAFTKMSEKPKDINVYEEKLLKGYRYTYKIIVRAKGGKLSDASELVTFVF